MSEKLIERRKALELSQAEVGVKVLRATTGADAPSESYAQKIVSLWERRHLAPNDQQLAEYAKVLELDEEVVRALVAGANFAVELFQQLKVEQHPSLVLACFSSAPKAPSDPALVAAVVEFVQSGHGCFGLVVPYPKSVDLPEIPGAEHLENIYRGVRLSVEAYAKELKRRAGPEAQNNVAVFVPCQDFGKTLIPPYWSRQVLVVRALDGVSEQTELFLWVRTKDLDELRPAAVEAPEYPVTEHGSWTAYFQAITLAWREDAHEFKREELGFWRRSL
ncbi:MAG: hypothetical protein K2Y23_10050 [Cyanobacteria bacterium]|nr:hypothetical protein [Cyanobacteriota bacterium]